MEESSIMQALVCAAALKKLYFLGRVAVMMYNTVYRYAGLTLIFVIFDNLFLYTKKARNDGSDSELKRASYFITMRRPNRIEDRSRALTMRRRRCRRWSDGSLTARRGSSTLLRGWTLWIATPAPS